MELRNHPGMELNPAAAAAYNAFEAKYGVHKVNSAKRTVQEQQELIDLWYSPNRPSWLFRPYMPAELGPHVRNGGEAVDLAASGSVRNQMAEFGFVWQGESDPVHYTHNGSRKWLDEKMGEIMANLDNDDKNWMREMIRQELGGMLKMLADSEMLPNKDWQRLMTRQEIGGAINEKAN